MENKNIPQDAVDTEVANLLKYFFELNDDTLTRNRDNFINYLKHVKEASRVDDILLAAIDQAIVKYDSLTEEDFKAMSQNTTDDLLEIRNYIDGLFKEEKGNKNGITSNANTPTVEEKLSLKDFLFNRKDNVLGYLYRRGFKRCYKKAKIFDFEGVKYVALSPVSKSIKLVSNHPELYKHNLGENGEDDYLNPVNSDIMMDALSRYLKIENHENYVEKYIEEFSSLPSFVEHLNKGEKALRKCISICKENKLDNEAINKMIITFVRWIFSINKDTHKATYNYLIGSTKAKLTKDDYENLAKQRFTKSDFDECSYYIDVLPFEAKKYLVKYLTGFITLRRDKMNDEEYGLLNCILYKYSLL